MHRHSMLCIATIKAQMHLNNVPSNAFRYNGMDMAGGQLRGQQNFKHIAQIM